MGKKFKGNQCSQGKEKEKYQQEEGELFGWDFPFGFGLVEVFGKGFRHLRLVNEFGG